jgi:large repetitive protein
MSIRVDGRPRRRRMVRTGRMAVLAGAATLTVLLAQHTTTAAFTAQTGDTGNTATTATTFCTSPRSVTVTTGVDSSNYGTNGNTTGNYSTATSLYVGTSNGGDAHALIRFDLPTLPSHCSITAATLRLYANTAQAGGTLDAYRIAAAWSSTTVTWATEPPVTPSPASTTSLAAPGAQSWPVTALVQGMYANSNYGFLIRDRQSLTSGSRFQYYDSFEGATPANWPKLDITWG